MARRRISLWVEDEMYEDYKRLAVALRQNTADVLRMALEGALPSSAELVRDLRLPADLLRSNGREDVRGSAVGWRRAVHWVRGIRRQ
jgi:hypothetical protein